MTDRLKYSFYLKCRLFRWFFSCFELFFSVRQLACSQSPLCFCILNSLTRWWCMTMMTSPFLNCFHEHCSFSTDFSLVFLLSVFTCSWFQFFNQDLVCQYKKFMIYCFRTTELASWVLFVQCRLHDGNGGDIYLAFNAHHFFVKAEIPSPPQNRRWHRVVSYSC